MRDLSVIIPARNEMFLAKTIENVLENIEVDTEVIAICDGNWPEPAVMDHPRVVIVHVTEPIGQRASTNLGARISQAKYIMKLDAHCAVGPGFDRILMEDCKPDWTMIPLMYRFRAFDWVCQDCGNRLYQGTREETCGEIKVDAKGRSWTKKLGCGSHNIEMDVVWEPRWKKYSVSWRFNHEMQFKYWKGHCKRPEAQGDLIETMSFIGACMLMERDRFWELEGMDEAHGSWGQFGTEIACKTWLSGGKLMTSRKTWFGHMFRTGNFRGAFEGNTFPYFLAESDVSEARKYSQDLWMNDKWDKAIHPLSWLVDKFKPVPDWHDKS